MTFAVQEKDGTRRFLSAHPVLFWFYDCHKPPEERRSFEVITEGAVCKLYFDLEFDKEFNSGSNGVEMVETFINIVLHFLKEEFGLSCNRTNVLDLDSTTPLKFSRHLVFQFSNIYFRNNYNAGNFVKMICDKVRLMVDCQETLQDFCTRCGITTDLFKNLFIFDKHGVTKLFCDEAVYTKNRHFRLYKSTKWGKNSPLLLSLENLYKPIEEKKERLAEKQLFLDSLITHVCEKSQDLTILEFGPKDQKIYVVKNSSHLPDCPVVREEGVSSPQPVLDRYIKRLVSPGVIRRSTYSSELCRIIYEISGNRFCHNIGRQHKSNNVYYVVDLKNFEYYQKCHDPDCSGYRSKENKLPPEIVFLLENEGDAVFESVSTMSDKELIDVWHAVSYVAATEELESNVSFESPNYFPEFGMSDSELLNSTLTMNENDSFE